MRDIKIQQQTQLESTQLEISEQLSTMHRQNCRDRLEFDYNKSADEEIDPGEGHVGGVDRTRGQDRLLDLDVRGPRRHRHQRVEIALRAAEGEVARLVRLVGADEGVIEREGVFEEVFAAVETPGLAPF